MNLLKQEENLKSKLLHNAHPVLVEWVDSMGASGWRTADQANLKCVTIGNLLYKKKDRICVALNTSAYGNGDWIEIPICSVRKIKKLKI